MKQFLSLTISAVLLAVLATTILVSCKKDMQKVACIANQISNKTEAQSVYEKIMKFRDAREAYHTDAKTDNGYVSPSEARSILDGTINYEFSSVNRYLDNTRLDTLRFAAPVTNNDGLVAVNDLIDIYDRFVASIGVNTNVVNFFMVLYPLDNTRDSDVEIIFKRGNTPPTPPTPPTPHYSLDYFDDTDNWMWPRNNGKCLTGGNSDAAQELSQKCQAMLSPRMMRDDIDTNSCNPWIYDLDIELKTYDSVQSFVEGVDYWLFHDENLTPAEASGYCITYDYLNLYLQNLYHYAISANGRYHYSLRYNSPVREIEIQNGDNNGYPLTDIWHNATLTFYKLGPQY